MPRAHRHTSIDTFRRLFHRRPTRLSPFAQPVRTSAPEPLPQAALFHYWHPDREGVEQCSPYWQRKLVLIHPGLRAVRPPARLPKHPHGADCRWILWQKDPTIQHPLCHGWKLLFLWPPKDYEPIPLDNRVIANLAIIDPRRYRDGLDYFEQVIQGALTEDRNRKDAEQKQYRDDRRHEYFEHTKISTAGRGNKFALHHDGSIVPSRGELNWLHERSRHLLPAEYFRREKEAKEKRKR